MASGPLRPQVRVLYTLACVGNPACVEIARIMTRNEYEQRKQRLEAQRRESLDLLEAFYRQQFLALELVWMASSGEEGSLPRSLASGLASPAVQVLAAAAPRSATPKPEPPKRKRWGAGELLNEVAAVLPQLPEVFDHHQVSQLLGSKPERSSLFRVLQELVQKNVLGLERRGEGRSPTRYRKLSPVAT